MPHDPMFSVRFRQNTLIPELAEWFRGIGGDNWMEQLDKFLRVFAGTRVLFPGHSMLAAIREDGEIVDSLLKDRSVESRLRLLDKYTIPNEILETLWLAATDRAIDPPMVSAGADKAAEAVAELIGPPANRPFAADLAMMYRLDYDQCVAVFGTARAQMLKVRSRLSQDGMQLLFAIRDCGGRAKVDRIKEIFRFRPSTVDMLVRSGLVHAGQPPYRGELVLTAHQRRR